MDLEPILRGAPVSRRRLLGAMGLAGAALVAGCEQGIVPSSDPSPGRSPAPAGGVEDALDVYCWSDDINPDTIEAFRRRVGVETVRYATYASSEAMLAGLRDPAARHDIAAPPAELVPRLAAEGLVQRLDRARIPNLRHIDPTFRGLAWDPTDRLQVPKDYGATGILVRSSLVAAPITSWRELYAVLRDGTYGNRVVFVDSMADVLTFPLKLIGKSLNSTVKTDLDEARRILLEVAPNVRALDSDGYGELLRTGEAVAALGWTAPLATLRADPQASDTSFVVPAEGTRFWLDSWVLLADAPHPDAAYAWLDFVHDPEIQAAETSYTLHATPNEAARALVDPELLADPAVFPPEELMDRLEPAVDTSGSTQRAEIWEEFRSRVGRG